MTNETQATPAEELKQDPFTVVPNAALFLLMAILRDLKTSGNSLTFEGVEKIVTDMEASGMAKMHPDSMKFVRVVVNEVGAERVKSNG